MYEQFYGLSGKPFQLNPDTAFFFGSRGHTVHTVESSQEALDFLETDTPDIVFIDLMMERYDSGFRLAFEIRKRERFATVPLIMLSGVARETGQRFDIVPLL